MLTYKVELTLQAAKSCKDKPIAKLLITLLAMEPGDELIIIGEDMYYPLNKLLTTLETYNLEIIEKEYDGLTYTIKCRKVG